MPKHVLHCSCWSVLMPVATGWSVAVWCHLQRHHQHANCLTHCALCSRAQLNLKQAQTCSNSAMCQIAGMLLQAAIWYACGCQACQRRDSRGTHAAAKAYQHCKQLQYQVVPGVLAAGPAMDGTAYLLATCLLPVVGFSDCSSAKCQAMHAIKALHGSRLLHGDIRESNNLRISEAEQSCKVILNDLGQSRLCTQEAAFQQELLQTQQLLT